MLIASLLAAMLMIATPGIAQAQTSDGAAETRVLTAEETSNLEALAAATTHESSVVFNADRALEFGASTDAVAEYGATFDALGGEVLAVESTLNAQLGAAARSDIVTAAATCRGKNGYSGTYWFGPQVALDECNTGALINGIAIAAGGGGTYVAASALTVAGLPAAAVVGVVSGILGLGVVFLNVCRDASGVNAIYLNGGVPSVVPPSCWGQ